MCVWMCEKINEEKERKKQNNNGHVPHYCI